MFSGHVSRPIPAAFLLTQPVAQLQVGPAFPPSESSCRQTGQMGWRRRASCLVGDGSRHRQPFPMNWVTVEEEEHQFINCTTQPILLHSPIGGSCCLVGLLINAFIQAYESVLYRVRSLVLLAQHCQLKLSVTTQSHKCGGWAHPSTWRPFELGSECGHRFHTSHVL